MGMLQRDWIAFVSRRARRRMCLRTSARRGDLDPTSSRHPVLPPADALRATSECGVGGAAAGISFEGLLDSVTIGCTTLLRPMTFVRRNPNGRGFDGLLGGGALRDFRVILDYSRGRLIWERAPSPAR